MKKVLVCQSIADQMGAAGYVVFDELDVETGVLVSYVYENQYNNWKASFRSY